MLNIREHRNLPRKVKHPPPPGSPTPHNDLPIPRTRSNNTEAMDVPLLHKEGAMVMGEVVGLNMVEG